LQRTRILDETPILTLKCAKHVRSLALWERDGVWEWSGARRHFILWGGSPRPMTVSAVSVKAPVLYRI